MKKQVLAVAGLGIGLLSIGVGASRQEPQVRYGELRISGISGQGIQIRDIKDAKKKTIGRTFTFSGSPLVATLPSHKLKVKTNHIEGKLDADNTLKTATLTGGVVASIDLVSDYGPETLTLTSEKAVYTDLGKPTSPDVKFDLFGGVKIHTENAAPQTMTLTGATGVARVRGSGKGDMNLVSANVDGNVVGDFAGVLKEKNHVTKAHIKATADHLVVTRGGDDGTDYLVEFSGNVTIHGTGQAGELNLQTSKILVVLDKDRMFKSLDGDDENPSATHGTVQQIPR